MELKRSRVIGATPLIAVLIAPFMELKQGDEFAE